MDIMVAIIHEDNQLIYLKYGMGEFLSGLGWNISSLEKGRVVTYKEPAFIIGIL